MRRRELLAVLGVAVAWPFATRAQLSGKTKRVAMIHTSLKPAEMKIGADPTYAIIFEEMKRLGYVEGVNLIVERYSPEGQLDRYAEMLHEVVATRPDVIFTIAGAPAIKALQSETSTIPIVAWTGDPIGNGLISSLARPGGNVTGLSVVAGPEFGTKRLQLFVEAVGKLSNIRVLGTPAIWEDVITKRQIPIAEAMNIVLRPEPLQVPINEAECRRAFEAMRQDHVDGVLIAAEPDTYTYRVLLGRLALQYRLPAISYFTDSVEAGALMSYGFDLKAEARRIAAQIVEVLNGGNPAEMPFIQETHFPLVINLKVAKELGLEIPARLVAIADEVIE